MALHRALQVVLSLTRSAPHCGLNSLKGFLGKGCGEEQCHLPLVRGIEAKGGSALLVVSMGLPQEDEARGSRVQVLLGGLTLDPLKGFQGPHARLGRGENTERQRMMLLQAEVRST